MEKAAMRGHTEIVLSAWNTHEPDRVVAYYTEDVVYLDPNTRGPVVGREAMRRYLTRLFRDWRMIWSLREFYPFADGAGATLLWDARLTPAAGGETRDVRGLDLIQVRGDLVSRNEVYFDRLCLLGA